MTDELKTPNSEPETPAADTADPNYFSYFSEIEDVFTRRRGKSLLIGPLDWALIESWQERGIPLHVVLRSIEEVFDNHKSRARKDAINSLRYCQSEVETQFTTWLDSQVGKNEPIANESVPGAVATGSDRNPFNKESIAAHLNVARAQLLTVDGCDGLKLVVLHVVEKLGGLKLGLLVAETVNARVLEDALTELDKILDIALRQSATPEQLATAIDQTHELLAPYKDRMPPEVYQQQIDTLLAKALRELFNVPRLSLFHMKG